MQSMRLLEAGSNFREYVDESHRREEARPRATPAPALQAGTSVGCPWEATACLAHEKFLKHCQIS